MSGIGFLRPATIRPVVLKSNSRSVSVGGAPRRARRRDARRDAILRAAGRIFRARGFADTGMRDIADAADLSPANLYHYFRGKDEILFYCQDRAVDRMLAAVAEARRATPSHEARLRQVLATHVRTLLDEIDGASAHVHLDVLAAPLRARIVGQARSLRARRPPPGRGRRPRGSLRRAGPRARDARHARRRQLDRDVVPPRRTAGDGQAGRVYRCISGSRRRAQTGGCEEADSCLRPARRPGSS